MKPLILIDTRALLQNLVPELARQQYLAVDTESNGYYAYHERICLIQISTLADDYILDPLAIGDLNGLDKLFADPCIEKIMHAASNDIAGFKRDFHFQVNNLFDTALACKLLGIEQLGLSRIINQHFGVELNKKWQRCNWGLRPLAPEQLEYARLDTHFLIDLRHLLAKDLLDRSLWGQAQETFARASAQEIPERTFDPQGYRRIREFRNLNRIGKQVLQALHGYRDGRARELDRAPFRVMSNETLMRLANHLPRNLDELQKTAGLPRPYRSGRLAGELLAVLQKAIQAAERSCGRSTTVSDSNPGQDSATSLEPGRTPWGENG
jgi:ribonuclease D